MPIIDMVGIIITKKSKYFRGQEVFANEILK